MIDNANKEDFLEVYNLINELEQETFHQDDMYIKYKEGLENPNTQFFVYRHENKVIGFISLYIQNHLHHASTTGEIVELIVLPEYRGLRIGDRLIHHVESYAKENKLIELSLSTSFFRKKAHRFYEAHGFIKDHYYYTKDI